MCHFFMHSSIVPGGLVRQERLLKLPLRNSRRPRAHVSYDNSMFIHLRDAPTIVSKTSVRYHFLFWFEKLWPRGVPLVCTKLEPISNFWVTALLLSAVMFSLANITKMQINITSVLYLSYSISNPPIHSSMGF